LTGVTTKPLDFTEAQGRQSASGRVDRWRGSAIFPSGFFAARMPRRQVMHLVIEVFYSFVIYFVN
jgi:hypothetical protein